MVKSVRGHTSDMPTDRDLEPRETVMIRTAGPALVLYGPTSPAIQRRRCPVYGSPTSDIPRDCRYGVAAGTERGFEHPLYFEDGLVKGACVVVIC